MNLKPFKETGLIEIKGELKVGQSIAHGDVIITRVADEAFDPSLPLETEAPNCLALGEHSGHAHKLFEDSKDTKIELRICGLAEKLIQITGGDATVKHQEHFPVKQPKGTYKSKIQRAYDPFTRELTKVRD